MVINFSRIIGNDKKHPSEIHKFNLERSSDCLEINIEAENQSWIQLFLWDGKGNLRLQRFIMEEENKIIIHKDPLKTDFCAVPGVLHEGEYTVEIFGGSPKNTIYKIGIVREDDRLRNNLDIDLDELEIWCDGDYCKREIYLNKYDFGKRISQGLRWYKGDFHTHTTLSDGKLSPIEGMKQAGKRNLDFFATTDHNILPCKWVKGKVLAIPGMEITAESSHFNAIGLKSWIDFRVNSEDGGLSTEEGMNRLLREAKDRGALRSINHPELYPWQWLNDMTLIENIDTIEVINDPTYPTNPAATEKCLRLWDLLWNDGYKIWGIGGSDSHMLPSETYNGSDRPSIIGDPGTYVMAEGLSAAEILEGVSKGRVYVSRDVEVDITILCDGKAYYPGSNFTEIFSEDDSKREVTYVVSFKGINDSAVLEIIENGEIIKTRRVEDKVGYSLPLFWQGSSYKWSRMQLRDENSGLILFTNPIFKGKQEHKLLTWGQLVQLAGGH